MARKLATPSATSDGIAMTATDIGTAIRNQRLRQGLRIDDAAALCGVSTGVMSRLENGAGSVALDKLLVILDGLGLVLVLLDKTAIAQLPADIIGDDSEAP